MENNQLAETLQYLSEQLNELTRLADNKTEIKKINTFKQQLLKVFPQAFSTYQLKGKIEQIIIEINNLYQNRIITPNESFNILLNIYANQNYGFTLSDMQQLEDSIKIHFSEATIRYEIFNSTSIKEDELLVMISFKP